MDLFAELLTGLALFVVLYLVAETLLHRRRLRRIPIRIHVNGTRGKSSVTRLITAGLRAGGKRVVAKTTGTLARVILPSDREVPVYRPLGANVREQVRIVRFAAEQEADVLVLECMALQPVLQWLSERMFVRATHGVITNARPDHLDVMGPKDSDVARALAGMMPIHGRCYTAEVDHLPILTAAANDRKSELITVGEGEVAAIGDDDLAPFEYFEHRANLALALRVCGELGVPREIALSGMWSAQPDPGAMVFHELEYFGRKIVFVNAFAANDPVSSLQIWDLCRKAHPEHKTVAVFNCRVDRADRSRQLGHALHSWTPPDEVVAVGSGTGFFARAAARSGADAIVTVEGSDARETFERLLELCAEETLIVGLGNIGGLGLDLVRLFRIRSKPKKQRESRTKARPVLPSGTRALGEGSP
ncbi:MAG: poly-gamma-glutamate synthase PgsB [Myxococcota bacterium]